MHRHPSTQIAACDQLGRVAGLAKGPGEPAAQHHGHHCSQRQRYRSRHPEPSQDRTQELIGRVGQDHGDGQQADLLGRSRPRSGVPDAADRLSLTRSKRLQIVGPHIVWQVAHERSVVEEQDSDVLAIEILGGPHQMGAQVRAQV